VEGLVRLRYMTSHPCDMSDELMDAHADVPQLMPFLHLPLQAGSDRILKAMNRKHTCDDYRRIMDRVRTVRPDIAISSDFIVGFPSETDADFQDTMRFVREIGFASSYHFKYSPRPGTPAADIAEQVPENVKTERLTELQTELEGQRQAYNASMIGQTLDVLLEREGRQPQQLTGKSPYWQAVQVDISGHSAKIGDVVRVPITSKSTNSLFGTPLPSH
jgi:tRNA-2-methylthio-N6-dimethylallyladenosine synthase